MLCPSCAAQNTQVIDSRVLDLGRSVRRRRKCKKCNYRFTTYEVEEIIYPTVVKNDGRREIYKREKVLGGIRKACEKRPIASEKIDAIVEGIEKNILTIKGVEIPTQKIGEMVMEKLLTLDPVAYARFASNYLDFENIEGFVEGIQKRVRHSSINQKRKQKYE